MIDKNAINVVAAQLVVTGNGLNSDNITLKSGNGYARGSCPDVDYEKPFLYSRED
ncbi:hypothetical protein EST38_g9604 [Candolleomyces aberdarensis]|uniref:Uncharacterized protein n=1 Tax=Candolleomyces aberdarensis TaxID=2316362 RepID=A0A4Q2D9I2_9AGAR|nr:hypothetical protein EST38_g9604 [Candolleomyces aberdarensis]